MPARSSALALLAVAVLASLASAPAAQAKNCFSQDEAESFGVSYVTSLKAFGTPCANAKAVVRAFHRCRKANGGKKGRCPKGTRVLGYRCRERRSSISTQITGKVTCRDGDRRVVHTYTQFT